MITWGEYEDKRDVKFLRTTLTERKKPRKNSKRYRGYPGAKGREGFRRACSTNNSAAGFQKIYVHWIWQSF